MSSGIYHYRCVSCLLIVLLLAGCASIEPATDREPEYTSVTPAATLTAELASLADRNHAVALDDGPSARHWRLRALRGATTSIDLQTFIWQADASGRLLQREILAAADRGVRVRVLLDDSFLAHADRSLHALSTHPLISYRIYNPLANRVGSMAMRELENLGDFSRINHRMHNKLLITDGRIAIIGGRNQADEYFGFHEEHNFRDLELLVAGPVLGELDAAFDSYWNDPWSIAIEKLSKGDSDDLIELREQLTALAAPALAGQSWLELFSNSSGGKFRVIIDTPAQQDPASEPPEQLAQQLVKLTRNSQTELILISAYFIPTPALTSAINEITARGVRVRILTNSLASNNHASADAAYARHRESLLRAGAELYEMRADASSRQFYLARQVRAARLGLHAKAIIQDNCCVFIGSANLDPRSLKLNTEMGLWIESADLNHEIRSLVERDFKAANVWRVTLDENQQLLWSSGDEQLSHSPPASFTLRLESWLFGLLPFEQEM